jgi:hypothetical protein
MATYELDFEVDAVTVATLACVDAHVCLARSSEGSAPSTPWLRYAIRCRCRVRWCDRYGLYASWVAGLDGRESVLATVPRVQPGHLYVFDGARFAPGEQTPDVARGHVDVRNDGQLAATIGLLQDATLDDHPSTRPVTATVVPPGFSADFAPVPILHAWIGAGRHDLRTVVAHRSLTINPPENQLLRLRYDPAVHTFIV